MWDPPSPGIKPVSPALAGRFFTTEPPEKLLNNFFKWKIFKRLGENNIMHPQESIHHLTSTIINIYRWGFICIFPTLLCSVSFNIILKQFWICTEFACSLPRLCFLPEHFTTGISPDKDCESEKPGGVRLVGLLALNGAGWVPASGAVPLLGGGQGQGTFSCLLAELIRWLCFVL